MTDENEETPEETHDMHAVRLPDGLAQAFMAMVANGPQPHDEQRIMQGEANELRIRNFIESLTDDQVDTFRALLHLLAAEGTGNYTTFYIEGIFMGEVWRRRPLSADVLSDAMK